MKFGAKELVAHLQENLNQDFRVHYSSREIDTMLQWLLEQMAQLSQVDILLNKTIELSEEQYQTLTQAIQRLNRDEPIQYILGEAEFYGRSFCVNSQVLIPRQETEELVGIIVQEWVNTPHLRVLDIGTGSGCIAITLAKELKNAQVHAVDSSMSALEVARRNASQLDADVTFIHLDILKDRLEEEYDIVVSNPPYVLKSEADRMRRNVLLHEPYGALFVDDTSPLLFYRRISELCRKMLLAKGCLYFEANEAYASEVALELDTQYFTNILVKKDLYGKERFIIAQRFS